MALNIYCTGCGSKHEYTLAKPKFCSSCGTPFEKGMAAAAPSQVTERPSVARKPSRTEIDIDDENVVIPDIKEIKIEIQVDAAQRFTFDDLKNNRVAAQAQRDRNEVYTVESLLQENEQLFARDRKNAQE